MSNKNKWLNQKIHKKCNKIQYASKHYGDRDNHIIFKRKNPLKQRRDRKKFKIQRKRKKIYKQMAFDYNDFIFHNATENKKRIQIRPTIQYQHDAIYDIESMYYDYYDPLYDHDAFSSNDCSQIRPNIDAIHSVIVSIERFHIRNLLKDTSKDEKHAKRNSHLVPQQHIDHNQIYAQENYALQRAIEASLQPQYLPQHAPFSSKSNDKNHAQEGIFKKVSFTTAYATIKAIGNNINYPTLSSHQLSKLKSEKIAMHAWKVYKHNVNIGDNISLGEVKLTPQRYDSYEKHINIRLQHILDCCVPFMWSVYGVIFSFVGYESIQITQINAKFPVVAENTQHGIRYHFNEYPSSRQKPSRNTHHGIRYHFNKYPSSKRRRYTDYERDIKSFIPTYFYYKTNEENKYFEIGSYAKQDWKMMSCFTRSKKRRQRRKRKPEQMYSSYVGSATMTCDARHKYHTRCPCGCMRKIPQKRGYHKIYHTLLRNKDCIDTNKRCSGWRSRWKGYRRHKPKEDGWREYHETNKKRWESWKYNRWEYGRRYRYRGIKVINR